HVGRCKREVEGIRCATLRDRYWLCPLPNPRGGGRVLLQELAESTGGRAVFPSSINELEEICAQISLELKSQYVLGYVPSNTTADGKWRKLRVKVSPPNGISHLNVRARAGYYATQTVDN